VLFSASFVVKNPPTHQIIRTSAHLNSGNVPNTFFQIKIFFTTIALPLL